MTDRPILFSAPMIRALLDGRKTQTRRVLKPEPFIDAMGNFCAMDRKGKLWNYGQRLDGTPCLDHYTEKCVRFAKGDRLWIKENWLPDPPRDHDAWDDWECSPVEFDGCGLKAAMVPPALRHADHALYAATWTGTELRWKPSIHMPRWASRLTLTATDVRVQRLQECSATDAIAEGIAVGTPLPQVPDSKGDIYHDGVTDPIDGWTRDPVAAYASLWDTINGAGAWHANPWVVALTFTVERRNIDAGASA